MHLGAWVEIPPACPPLSPTVKAGPQGPLVLALTVGVRWGQRVGSGFQISGCVERVDNLAFCTLAARSAPGAAGRPPGGPPPRGAGGPGLRKAPRHPRPAAAALGGPGPEKTQERGGRQDEQPPTSGPPRPPQRKGARPQPDPAGPPTTEPSSSGGAPHGRTRDGARPRGQNRGSSSHQTGPRPGQRSPARHGPRPDRGAAAATDTLPPGRFKKRPAPSGRHHSGVDEHEATSRGPG